MLGKPKSKARYKRITLYCDPIDSVRVSYRLVLATRGFALDCEKVTIPKVSASIADLLMGWARQFESTIYVFPYATSIGISIVLD